MSFGQFLEHYTPVFKNVFLLCKSLFPEKKCDLLWFISIYQIQQSFVASLFL